VKREQGSSPAPGSVAPAGPLETAIAAAARGGRIPCAEVFRVTAAHGATLAEAGAAVERLGIRIAGCQLGCF
jgi:hypothetical protein